MNTIINVTNYILSWKSKGLSDKTIKPPTTSDNSLTPVLKYYGTIARVKFTESCLQQHKLSYTHVKVVNIYIVYKLGASSSQDNDPTLKNCLFGAVSLTKNVDIDKYGYSGYGIGSDRKSSFSFTSDGFGQNVIISWRRYEFVCTHSNSWERSNTRLRTYTNCRANVLD